MPQNKGIDKNFNSDLITLIQSFKTSLNPVGLQVSFGILFIRFGHPWVNLQQVFGAVSVL